VPPARAATPLLAAGLLAAAAPARADAPRAPLGRIEARITGGIAVGGGGGQMLARPAPFHVGAFAHKLMTTEQPLWLRGGLFVEIGDRTGIGGAIGARTDLGRWIATASVQVVMLPYTLLGASAQLGRRFTRGTMSVVPALELVVYGEGNDLPDGKVDTQALLGVGVELDAW
jgi:hypothetical protein